MPNILPPTATTVSIPAGIIEIWAGTIATIPDGWALCDGLNGRPNLLDQFVKGTPDTVTEAGTTGGQAVVSLTLAELASHSHTVTETPHSHDSLMGTPDASNAGISQGGSGVYPTGFQFLTRLSSVNPNIGFTGSGSAHNNIPPFFEVAYIIKL